MGRPNKTGILIKPGSITDVHDPFSFSAPPLTGHRDPDQTGKHPGRSWSIFFFCTAAHRSPSRRGGIHGMQGVLENRV